MPEESNEQKNQSLNIEGVMRTRGKILIGFRATHVYLLITLVKNFFF